MDEASEDKTGVIDLIKSMVTVAEIAKLQKYLRANKSGVDVLNKLQLGDDIEAVLGSPKLDTLGMYIHMFNAQDQNRQNKISLSGTLTARYGEDVVGNMLVIEKGFYITNVITTNLQAQQLKGWLEIGKSADEVFNLLKLRNGGISSLTARKLEPLDIYIQLLNAKNPQKTTSLF